MGRGSCGYRPCSSICVLGPNWLERLREQMNEGIKSRGSFHTESWVNGVEEARTERGDREQGRGDREREQGTRERGWREGAGERGQREGRGGGERGQRRDRGGDRGGNGRGFRGHFVWADGINQA